MPNEELIKKENREIVQRMIDSGQYVPKQVIISSSPSGGEHYKNIFNESQSKGREFKPFPLIWDPEPKNVKFNLDYKK